MGDKSNQFNNYEDSKGIVLKSAYRLTPKGREEYDKLGKSYISNIFYHGFAGGAISYLCINWILAPAIDKLPFHTNQQKSFRFFLYCASLSYFLYQGKSSSDYKFAKAQFKMAMNPEFVHDPETIE